MTAQEMTPGPAINTGILGAPQTLGNYPFRDLRADWLHPDDGLASVTPITDAMQPVAEAEAAKVGRWEAFKGVLRGAVEDVRSGETRLEKAKIATLGAVALGVQAADRIRYGVVLTAGVAMDLLERTGMSDQERITTAAVGAAAVNFAWNGAVGETFRQGIKRYPKTVEGFTRGYPSFVRLFGESLPGLKQGTEPEPQHKKQLNIFKRTLKRLPFHASRGGAGLSLGPTAFVATASTQERPDAEIRDLNIGVSKDTASFVGGIVLGAGSAITALYRNGHPELAMDIQNTVSDSKFLWSVSGLMVLGTYLDNRRKDKKAAKALEGSAA